MTAYSQIFELDLRGSAIIPHIKQVERLGGQLGVTDAACVHAAGAVPAADHQQAQGRGFILLWRLQVGCADAALYGAGAVPAVGHQKGQYHLWLGT